MQKKPGGVTEGGSVRVDNSRVSVVIPARNEEKRLPLLLRSLETQTEKAGEVIIVDDNSEDATASAGTAAKPEWVRQLLSGR